MNEIPSEMLRGHIDTIILLCLTESDMHTNQIQEEIEKRAGGDFQLKQGTFYGALQRIVKQGYVKQYRTTNSEDGVRRKFYQLTEKGKIYIDENKDKWTYSREMINVLIETPKQSKTDILKNNAQEEPVVNKEIEDESSPEEALQEFLSANMANEVPEEKTVKTIEPIKEEESPEKPVKKASKNQDNYDLFKYIDLTQSEIYEEEKEVEVAEAETVEETANSEEEQKTDEVAPNIEEVVEKVVEKVVERVVERLPEVKEDTNKEEEQMAEVAIASSDEPQQSDIKIVYVETVPQSESEINNVQNDYAEIKKDKIDPENDDFYNGEQPITGDYKLVLSNIFDDDKPKKEKVSEAVYQEGMDINRFFGEESQKVVERKEPEPAPLPPKKVKVKQQKQKPVKQDREEQIETYKKLEVVKHPYYDFSDIQSMADKEGFRIKVSSTDRKQDNGRILINKLLFHSSLSFFLIILVETILIYFATKDIAQLSYEPYVIFLGIMAIMPIYTAILYIINKDKKVYKIYSFKSALELMAIIMLNLIIIEIVCCVLANLDFSNQKLVVRYVLYPILFVINLPIYLFIKYLKLDKNNYYM